MGVLHDTTSTKRKPSTSNKPTRSTPGSSGLDSATLETIQSLQRQIADLEAKEEARGELTKAQAAKMETLEAELKALKTPTLPAVSGDFPPPATQSKPAGRLAPWCPW